MSPQNNLKKGKKSVSVGFLFHNQCHYCVTTRQGTMGSPKHCVGKRSDKCLFQPTTRDHDKDQKDTYQHISYTIENMNIQVE